jgi:hypothetical protein
LPKIIENTTARRRAALAAGLGKLQSASRRDAQRSPVGVRAAAAGAPKHRSRRYCCRCKAQSVWSSLKNLLKHFPAAVLEHKEVALPATTDAQQPEYVHPIGQNSTSIAEKGGPFSSPRGKQHGPG